MRFLFVSLLLVSSGFGNSASAQQPTNTPLPPVVRDQDKPRIFVTDSNSWSTQSSAGGGHGAFAASSSGGARPQTAEIIKTFGQRCPNVIVNNRPDVSDYIVELDHEGGKGVFAHKDKIAVFVQKSGDSIFSKSTLSVGGSVQDACTALIAHWGTHSSELRAVLAVPLAQVAVAAVTLPAAIAGITVDASMPNCDIEVDGSFVGSTPSTLNLAPGKHAIVVKKTGYRDWSRNMTVASGAVRISADMVAVN
jgi:hypothetical protein